MLLKYHIVGNWKGYLVSNTWAMLEFRRVNSLHLELNQEKQMSPEKAGQNADSIHRMG